MVMNPAIFLNLGHIPPFRIASNQHFRFACSLSNYEIIIYKSGFPQQIFPREETFFFCLRAYSWNLVELIRLWQQEKSVRTKKFASEKPTSVEEQSWHMRIARCLSPLKIAKPNLVCGTYVGGALAVYFFYVSRVFLRFSLGRRTQNVWRPRLSFISSVRWRRIHTSDGMSYNFFTFWQYSESKLEFFW